MDSVSYSLGVLVAQDLKSQGFDDINPEAFSQALADVMNGRELKVGEEEASMVFQTYAMQKQEEKNKAQKTFLEENAKREGVTTLPSGLQYEVLKKGEGESPSATDKVTVHYHGTLIDGTVFDSSVERGEPATFPVNGVIKGWVEALQLMQVGDKWKLFIPSELAYGSRGAGQVIGPGATLVFEVELLSIN
ncbi:MAG: FKBP-type peptidyl-prolyl cis-trans isomerase [Saprospiraceae bacterium]|nr:FKBP-type peptidyl-prolyl cis-trans isomerase [Saprospiraceae bacterium]MCB0626677.1 FKBP-type peptidyl-prolyl cis-trans isomerase [Saprospiraceae bacterium]MCB0677744.1 FKBP-type peptidyl-prolyl cis-trans isomerase [Saprospiraceae bacterium]